MLTHKSMDHDNIVILPTVRTDTPPPPGNISDPLNLLQKGHETLAKGALAQQALNTWLKAGKTTETTSQRHTKAYRFRIAYLKNGIKYRVGAGLWYHGINQDYRVEVRRFEDIDQLYLCNCIDYPTMELLAPRHMLQPRYANDRQPLIPWQDLGA